MRVGVTGASGFVGRALVSHLQQRGVEVVPIVRKPFGFADERVAGDLSEMRSDALPPLNVLIHLAALAHTPIADPAEADARFHAANVIGTQRVLRAAAAASVKHVLFVSSIKVNGERTEPGKPFTETDTPAPEDAYGRSKWQAEQIVRSFCAEASIRCTIVRPPLVYGRDVSANFRKLAKLACSPLPLPLGGIGNARSLVHVGNLVDALATLSLDLPPSNETYLISDGQDVSTSDLLRMLAHAQRRTLRLLPSGPVRLLTSHPRLLALHQRLFSSLQVDSSKLRTHYGWVPPFSLQDALAETFR